MAGIFRGPWGRASWLCLAVAACGGARAPNDKAPGGQTRTIPLSEAIVLETSGAPPSDTVVTVTAGDPHVV
ncbi:MAG TPA: hypothetical protein VJ817_02280, partial [Gemmatimonadales bacterium]|nr:hypothetical protein [Gemmatimonadales bacterium]